MLGGAANLGRLIQPDCGSAENDFCTFATMIHVTQATCTLLLIDSMIIHGKSEWPWAREKTVTAKMAFTLKQVREK